MISSKHFRCVAWIATTMLVASAARSAENDFVSSDAALAPRLCEMAQNLVRAQATPSEANLKQAAALLDTARRCDPNEAIYARLSADVHLQLRDTPGALDALNALRRLHPQDRQTQAQVIDLYVSQMQTIDQRLDYLKGILPNEAVAAEVRSIAAARLASLLWEKGQNELGGKMLEEAIRLNPVNPTALGMKYRALPASSTPAQRVEALLAILRANPANLEIVLTLARGVASVGMAPEALRWYSVAGAVAARQRQSFPPEIGEEVAALMLIADQPDAARNILDGVLKVYPDNYRAAILRMLLEDRGGKREAVDKLRVQARNGLIKKLLAVRTRMGIKAPQTQPSDDQTIAVPDLSGDVRIVKGVDDTALRTEYLETVAALAWFEIYFDRWPEESEKTLKVISELVDPAAEPWATFITRTTGWNFLIQRKMDEAKVKLSAVADRDAMANLGLGRMYAANENDTAKAKEALTRALRLSPSGVNGAVIAEAARSVDVKVAPTPAAAGVPEALAKFPSELLKIIDNPQMFYALRGEPLRINNPFGEPIYAKVTLQNVSQYDLTIGRDGVLGPDLWFDVQFVGLVKQRPIAGACVDRIPDAIVLKPRHTVTQTVRLDQGILAASLLQIPAPPIGLSVAVRTNPVILSEGGVASGPAGYATDFMRPMERAGFAASDESFKRVISLAESASPRERMRNMQLMLSLIADAARGGNSLKDPPAKFATALDVLPKCRSDTDPGVRAFAAYAYASDGPPEDCVQSVQRMLLEEGWQSRLLGLVVMQRQRLNQDGTTTPAIPRDRQKTMVQDLLGKEKDPLVREYAAATLKTL